MEMQCCAPTSSSRCVCNAKKLKKPSKHDHRYSDHTCIFKGQKLLLALQEPPASSWFALIKDFGAPLLRHHNCNSHFAKKKQLSIFTIGIQQTSIQEEKTTSEYVEVTRPAACFPGVANFPWSNVPVPQRSNHQVYVTHPHLHHVHGHVLDAVKAHHTPKRPAAKTLMHQHI
jgi:hypothetical protein